MQRLSARKWVSMAVERALEVSPNSLTFLQSERATASNFQKELKMAPSEFKLALGYMVGQDQERDSQSKDASDVFQAGTPGVLSLEELDEKVDLGQWGIRLGQRVVRLEVNTASYSSALSRHAADMSNRTLLVGMKVRRPIHRQSKGSRQSWLLVLGRNWSKEQRFILDKDASRLDDVMAFLCYILVLGISRAALSVCQHIFLTGKHH